MKISSKAHYGLQAAYILAEKQSESFSATELGKEMGVSAKYLERIMRALCGAGTVKASRGINGGYSLARDPKSITVGEIVRALEDDLEIIGCVKSGSCEKCASSAVWKKLYDGINSILDSVSLADMVESEQKSHSACGEGRTAVKPSATCSCGSCPANCECSSGSQKKQK